MYRNAMSVSYSTYVLNDLNAYVVTRHPRHPRCSLATTVRVRLADQSTVLVTGSGAQGALRSSGVTLWHITGAASLGVALGTAEVTGQALHTHRLLIRFAASAWVAVVGGVGCHSDLHCQNRALKMSHIIFHIVTVLNFSTLQFKTSLLAKDALKL